MNVELLGSPGVREDGGNPVKVAGRQRVLLALLALDAPRPVSVDRLLDALWGDQLPADPANALQQRISSLRKAVDPQARGDVLIATPGGYALRVDDDLIDARRFGRMAARGSSLLATGDAAGALGELDAALALWRGDALEGFADEPWAQPDAQRLTEARLAAIEDRYDAALAHGVGPEPVGDLRELVTTHPLRERLTGQLMLALYRDGRQAEALGVYDDLRRRLVDELGVDPGPALQNIYRQVLDQDTALQAARSQPLLPTKVDNLPAAGQAMIGREDALAQLDQLLTRSRLVTLTGPGGAGKTTLAIAAARRRPRPVHGTWMVELASLADEDAISGEIAAIVGIGSGGLGAAAIGSTALGAALRDRQLLLVLDNCEHVVEPAARLVERLLAAAPTLTILATSREPLGLAGEQLWVLPPLRVPGPADTSLEAIVATPAVRLLIERVRQHDPWFDLTPDAAPSAGALVRELDGLPLAIELAAAQLRVLTLPELLASLRDRSASLATTLRSAPPRQRTLRAALDWSWELLDDGQRTAWATLAVCAGSFARPTAARLLGAAGCETPTLDALRGLVDRSLLIADTDVVPARYRMFETIRSYGRNRLEELGLRDAVGAEHAGIVEDGLVACHTTSEADRFGVDLDELGSWLDDARAALGWADTAGEPGRVQRLAGQLGWLWLLRGLAGEGIGWLDRGLGPAADVDPARVDPMAALWASGLRLGGAHQDGGRWAAIALAAATRPQDRVVAGVYAAVHDAHAGDLDGYTARLAATRAEAERIGGWPLGFCLLVSAQLGRLAGRFGAVREDAEAALELLVDPGLEWARALAIDIVIDAVIELPGPEGGYQKARELAREGLALCRGRRLPELEARLRLQLGRALHELGEVEQGRRHLEDAVLLAESAGGGVGLGFALLVAGSVARRRGEPDVAARQLSEALGLLQGTATAFGTIEANVELAVTAILSGDPAGGRDHAATALGLAHGTGEPGLLARALEACAGAYGQDGSPEAPARLLAAAAALRARTGARPDPAEQGDLDEVRAGLCVRYGAGFDGLVAEHVERSTAELDATISDLVAQHAAVEHRAVTGP